MSRMFCTVQEAARTLNTSEDRINALLERGILQEFREGSRRLLREADVGALDLRRGRPWEAQPAVPPPARSEQPSRGNAGKPKARPPAQRRDAESCVSTARPTRPRGTKDRGTKAQDVRPRPADAGQKTQDPELQVARRPARRSVVRPAPSVPPATTVRQWFWMGLVQDRPAAIALLSGLVLLGLAALAAAVCLLAEGL